MDGDIMGRGGDISAFEDIMVRQDILMEPPRYLDGGISPNPAISWGGAMIIDIT